MGKDMWESRILPAAMGASMILGGIALVGPIVEGTQEYGIEAGIVLAVPIVPFMVIATFFGTSLMKMAYRGEMR